MVIFDPLAGGHGDAVSYVLGTLDAGARARFEAHVVSCAECERELRELQPVVDELALAVPQVAPPSHLRQRLLTRAHLSRDAVPAPAPAPVRLPVPPPLPVLQAPLRQRLMQRLMAPVTAASLLVALTSAGYAYTAQRQLSEASRDAEYATAQLTETLYIVYQPNMVTKTLVGTEAAPAAKGKVLLAPDRNRAVVMASDLPRLRSDESYQCWLTNQEERRVDGGTFKTDRKGHAYWVLRTPEALARYRTLGITREPVNGSPSPTGPRVLGGQL